MCIELLQINDLIRIGRNFDGGYVISESLMKNSSLLLSFGINDDWSFEEDFCNRNGVKCYAFDFSIDKNTFLKKALKEINFFFGDIIKRKKISNSRLKMVRENFVLHNKFNVFFKSNFFFSYGIDKITQGKFKKLDDILSKYFENKENIFLKLDIEGCEFYVIDDVLNNKQKFHGLAMEIHNIQDCKKDFDQLIKKINQHFYIYHVHANNYGNMQTENDFPGVIEISCIRKDLVSKPFFYENWSHLPIENLDFPNDPNSPDFKWQL